MRALDLLVLVAVVPACGNKDTPTDKADKPTPKPANSSPLPVTFGDCAGPAVAFVSGPRPLPFTAEQADGVWTAAATPSDDPPPPEDEAGGTGTAMALDEGKMGKQDSDRAAGAYNMKRVDPAVARQQAIDAARTAGILGNVGQGEGAFASLVGTGDLISADAEDVYGALLGATSGDCWTGWGLIGGGGTGWGTIGTGRYGTIGRGTGTGYGYGVGGMRGRRGSVPTITIGQPTAVGDLDKAIIRRYIKRNFQKLQYCYEKELLAKPYLAGTITTQFFIAPTGAVTQSTGSGFDKTVASCVASVIKNIEFPKPKTGGVQVTYPFTMRPVDWSGDSQLPRAPATGSAAAGSAAAGAGSDSTAVVAKPPERELFRTPSRGFVDVSRYVQGATNPLRTEQAALTECFRSVPGHHGAVVVALTYDAAGAVTTATVNGVDDASAAACITAAAKRVKRITPGLAAQRCPVAFGELPVTDLTTIDITADIRLDGKTFTATPDAKLPDLTTRMKERRAAAVSVTPAPIVTIHNPVVVRPLDATPMKVVNGVVASVLAAGEDVVLAARRGADWKLLHAVTFPLAPVPFGTGGPWNHFKSSCSSSTQPVTLSVLITADAKISVRQSGKAEVQEVAGGTDQRANLLTILKTHKLVNLAGRVDLEIAGANDVPYGEVIKLIDTAVAAEFTDWRLTGEAGLTTRPPR